MLSAVYARTNPCMHLLRHWPLPIATKQGGISSLSDGYGRAITLQRKINNRKQPVPKKSSKPQAKPRHEVRC